MRPSLQIAQCYQNIHCLLGYYCIPEPKVLGKMTNKVTFEACRDLEDRLDWLTAINKFERWDFVRNHGVTAKSGWRERVARYSAQIVVHDKMVEIDIDYWNPNFGLAPMFMHGLECISPAETNPFKVAKGLNGRGIKVPIIGEDNA